VYEFIYENARRYGSSVTAARAQRHKPQRAENKRRIRRHSRQRHKNVQVAVAGSRVISHEPVVPNLPEDKAPAPSTQQFSR
jgi:hypothetical protein